MCWPLAFQATPLATQHNRGLNIIAPKGNRPDLVLDPVVVDGDVSIRQVMGQCRPSLQGVVDRLFALDDPLGILLRQASSQAFKSSSSRFALVSRNAWRASASSSWAACSMA